MEALRQSLVPRKGVKKGVRIRERVPRRPLLGVTPPLVCPRAMPVPGLWPAVPTGGPDPRGPYPVVPGAPPAWGLSCPSIYSPVGMNSPARTPGAGSRVTGCVCPGDHEPAAGSGRRLAGCGLGRESLAPEDSPGQGQRHPTRQLATRHSFPGKTGRPPQLSLFLAVASCRGDTSADTPTQGGPGWGFLPRNPLESRSCRAHPQLGFHQISREWGRKACGPPAPRVGQGTGRTP